MSDLRNKIQTAEDIQFEDIDCPEWDCKIRIQTMSGNDRMNMMARVVGDPQIREHFGKDGELSPDQDIPLAALMTHLVIACARDPETNELVFTWDDLGWLGNKNGDVLQRLGMAAVKQSGVGSQAVVEAMGNSSSPVPDQSDAGT